MTLLEAKNISVYLGDHLIVKDVSLKIQKGELIGIIGSNGTGKTTLLKSLARLLPFKSGDIELSGHPLKDITHKALSQSLSYMAQGDTIHWPLKVEKVVALGRLPHLSAWQQLSQQDAAAIQQSMALAEIDHLSGRTVTKLSGGEKRLVMLARAIAVQSNILLADEPVSGLDPNHQIQVMQLLRKMAEDGRGVAVVLHDLSLAARYCHKLYLLNEGKILVSGTPKEVLTSKNLETAYGITAKYGQGKEGFYVVPWGRVQKKEKV